MKTNKKGLSILEYAVVITACVAALLVMQVYIQRSMQGRLRSIADEISQQHYAPGHTNSDVTFETNSTVVTETTTSLNEAKDRLVTTSNTTFEEETQRRYGYEDFEE